MRSGWINLDKPLGLSSMQALARVKRVLKVRDAGLKAGHAGTLDPLASGVLPIALGEATKLIDIVMDHPKTYEFTVRWGQATSTDDAEGEVIETSDVTPTPEQIQAVLPQFTGIITQRPPAFSAIKIDGQRAYALARRGDEVEMPERQVEVFSLKSFPRLSLQAESSPRSRGSIDQQSDHWAMDPRLRGDDSCGGRANRDDNLNSMLIDSFILHCSKGTYVRSLARDMARALGTCGHVVALRRVACGPFNLENIISLDRLAEMGHEEAWQQVLPLGYGLDDILAVPVSAAEADKLRRGQPIKAGHFPENERKVACLDGQPVAIIDIRHDLGDGQWWPARVLVPETYKH